MKFYTVKQAALILGFSTNSIYKFLEEGRLKGVRGNAKQGRFKIAHSHLESFLKVKLPEDALAAAVQKHAKMQTKKETSYSHQYPPPAPPPAPSTPATTSTSSSPVHSATITRVLIIIALVGLLVDLVINQNYTLIQNGLRLTLLSILILLTYQYGGFTTPKPLAKSDAQST